MTLPAATPLRVLGTPLRKLGAIAHHAATRQAGGEWLAAVVIILMVVPAGPNHVLIPMLAVTAGLGAAFLLGATRVQTQIRSAIVLFAAAGAALAIHGFIRSNEGWVDVTIPLVGGPVAWFLMAQLGNDWFAKRAVDIAAIATIIISLMVCALNFGVLDGIVRWIEPAAFSVRTLGRSRTNLVGLTTLIATVPIVISSVLDRIVVAVPTPRFALHLTAALLSMPAVLLSGRQALTGALAVLPFLLVIRYLLGFSYRGSASRQRRRVLATRLLAGCAVGAIIGLGAIVALDLSPIELVRDLFASIGVGDTASSRVGYSADVRWSQSNSLLAGFSDRPIFGHGAGAVSEEFGTWRGYDRGDGVVIFDADFEPRPWRAELSYQLLLFEGGVVGFLLYIAAAAWANSKVLAVYRELDPTGRSVLRATVLGALSILVGAAFNPHLRAVGAQVLLFLPVMVAAGASGRATTSQVAPDDRGTRSS